MRRTLKTRGSLRRYTAWPVVSVFLISSALLVLSSCHYYNLERNLRPDHKEFLNKVRYIVTKEESRIFLDLPDSEKDAFIEEFWRRRDPTPDTEENEFKIEYDDRIERANDLFVSEGKAGWLTDRGRIYILFGPPMDRITYPMGGDPYSRCREIWYYGNFPVVFLDETCTGNYKLVTYDLTGLRDFNLMYMHELSLAQQRAQQTVVGESKLFNFDWKIDKKNVEAERVEAEVYVDVPYASIWFRDEEGKLATTLEVRLELRDGDGEIVWDFFETYEVKADEEELKADRSKKFRIEIPFVLTENLDRLRRGKNRMFIILKNQTGGEEQKKVLAFDL